MGRTATLQRRRRLLPLRRGCSGRHGRPRRSSASYRPGGILYTELSAEKRGLQLSQARSDPGTGRFRPTSCPGTGTPTAAAAAAAARTGGCCYQIPSPERPPHAQASSARHPPGVRGWCAPPSVAAAPPLRCARPHSAPAPAAPLRGLQTWATIYCGATLVAIALEAATTRAQSSGARTGGSQRWAGLWVIWILRAAAGLICTFLLSGKVEISQRPPTLFFFRGRNRPTPQENQDAPAGPSAPRPQSAATGFPLGAPGFCWPEVSPSARK